MIEKITVKQLATLAGVSVRTLHYYDEIDLLSPAVIGENSYRYYDDASLFRLQQILLYREMGIELTQIKQILDNPSFDRLSALQTHRENLLAKIGRYQALIQTVDQTIHHITGDNTMSKKQIFQGFDEAKQKEYEQEAVEQWGDTARDSIAQWNNYSKEKQEGIKVEGDAIYNAIADNMDQGADSAVIQELLGRWHQHLRYFYEPSLEMLIGLGNMYEDNPEFKANFTKIHPQLSVFLKAAIPVYVDKLKNA